MSGRKKVLILGGDGFIGWPTALHLSARGHPVDIADNLSRRRIDEELGVQSLTPIASIDERIETWEKIVNRKIGFRDLDVAADYDGLKQLLTDLSPDTVVHLAEQRAAPYSMKSDAHKNYTVTNNIATTHNLLNAIVETELRTHVVHIGTMGVYGYNSIGAPIPEGYLDVDIAVGRTRKKSLEILYPSNPGSIYHLTKCMDQLMFAFYARNDGLRVTDLHQGIVWGVQTEETALHPDLSNRFDYDGDYGTVLNRFLIQAAMNYPLTVHGTGGQTRAFIHIRDTVRCIELALDNPPVAGDRVKVINQMTETHRVRDLARLIESLTGATVSFVPNPRKEADENELLVENGQLLQLGLKPITLSDGLLEEIMTVATPHLDRVDPHFIPCLSAWTKEIAQTIAAEEVYGPTRRRKTG